LVVHPGPGHPDHTLVNAILAHCPEIGINNDLVRPGIVHRLDKDTSGLIVIAKNNQVKENLIKQFKNRVVIKYYLVLVKGQLFPEKGIIEAAIGRDPHNFKRMAVVANGKEAITCYTVRRRFPDYTLLDVNLKTGRTHQIRVHLSAIGHAVAGDLVYGQISPYVNRQFVHASHLGFYLPSTGIFRNFNSPLPFDLEESLKQLGNSI
jgi:23S rRNA pseudouridine1911/1915/1917 synthase